MYDYDETLQQVIDDLSEVIRDLYETDHADDEEVM